MVPRYSFDLPLSRSGSNLCHFVKRDTSVPFPANSLLYYSLFLNQIAVLVIELRAFFTYEGTLYAGPIIYTHFYRRASLDGRAVTQSQGGPRRLAWGPPPARPGCLQLPLSGRTTALCCICTS